MRTILIFGMLLLLTRSTQAYPPICERIDLLAQALGWELIPWIGYPDGWDKPRGYIEQTLLFPDSTGGVEIEYAPSTGERFVWYFDDYVVDGEPRGLHHFCGPYRSVP